MKILDRFVSGLIQHGTLTISAPGGWHRTYGRAEQGYPDLAIKLTDEKVVNDVIADPWLASAEAYMDGRIIIEKGDIFELLALFRANHPWDGGETLPLAKGFRWLQQQIAGKLSQFNPRGRSRRNVSHHYDLGNAFYKLFLDENMQYSCAYWHPDTENLDQAQQDKLAHIAAKLKLKPGQRVLDIGCGWGGMALYLARHYNVEVLGVTLSTEQLALAREKAKQEGLDNSVRFELLDYRDLAKEGATFDRIVSVGMFEHVGKPQYRTFFRSCRNLLSYDGLMVLHTIGRMGDPEPTDAFTLKYIFPGGYMPALSEIAEASQHYHLLAADVEMLRVHYAKTLRAWYERTLEQREAIEAMYDPRFFRMWTYYLAGASVGFEYGNLCVYQIVYSRNRHALPLTRPYFEPDKRSVPLSD
ncbi:class I SAM-dependent methyltransferase [Altericroceibacterium spongiae]|uniref:Class I SAM-dependent methyltransferase n=1 Tax=Altericroceibacterium spongiae TaxID=2320269 RepID=A0A420EFF3_9SPHN|nr:cyclopropane-fatty-acyl-phospholipid synthase family protein [Altericroceibacterium spongiae]RKF19441.1 class I SAM-dependent methyltransferase [Altericroceibacterium spongiae]